MRKNTIFLYAAAGGNREKQTVFSLLNFGGEMCIIPSEWAGRRENVEFLPVETVKKEHICAFGD